MRSVIPAAVIISALLLSACQRPAPQASELQARQISSLIAGTRYLKSQCSRTDLPGDGQIEQAAYRAAHQRGWTLTGSLAEQSESLYQQLLRDPTPQVTQCAEFSQLLQPFLTTLPKA